MADAWDLIDGDAGVRVAILTGAGDSRWSRPRQAGGSLD
jgi:enoyl-CoA hydratase/carnithine racemase